ncbi:TolC family protein [Galbibacter sp. PAP.153]|uniref:TolC family protein n=1 Tax=Galbibacter sp. PAP.153 TaxID=3104623 RepID=UPI00300B56CC
MQKKQTSKLSLQQKLRKYIIGCGLLWLMCFTGIAQAQNANEEFTYDEFLGIVKKYHPLVKQANLIVSASQAKLLKARGYFDPKISADFYKKRFDDKEYYNLFNGNLKVPTWYGVEFKAAFDRNQGEYLNPENYVPEDGLASIGVSVPIGQGLWINERMAEVKKGKLYRQLGDYERTLAVMDALFEASEAYLDWKQQYEKVMLYERFYHNALERQQWIKKAIELGELSPIDSVESGIILKTRKLERDQAELKLTKSRLHLSNYLWAADDIPLELSEKMVPEENLKDNMLDVLGINPMATEVNLENHPKLNALSTKIDMKEVDRKLKANKLLPKLRLNYNYIAAPNYFNNYNWDDYKIGASLSFPILLRKERAEVKIAEAELNNAQYGLQFQRQTLQNKVRSKYAELESYQSQMGMNMDLIADYKQMLDAEVRLFELGESSIFYINTRENKLVKAKVTQIELENTYFLIVADLYRALAKI